MTPAFTVNNFLFKLYSNEIIEIKEIKKENSEKENIKTNLKEKEKNRIKLIEKFFRNEKKKVKERPKAKSENKTTPIERIINLLKKKTNKITIKKEPIKIIESPKMKIEEDFITIKDESTTKQKAKERLENSLKEKEKVKTYLNPITEEIEIIEDEANNKPIKLNDSIQMKIIELDNEKDEKKESIINIDQDSTDGNDSEYEKFIKLVNETNSENHQIYSELKSLIKRYGYQRVIFTLLLKSNFIKNEKIKDSKDENIFNFEEYMKDNEFKTNFYHFKDILNEALFRDYNSMMMKSKKNQNIGMNLNLNLINARKIGNKIHSIERIKGNFKDCVACFGNKKEKVDYYCSTCKNHIHPECFVKYHKDHKLNFI